MLDVIVVGEPTKTGTDIVSLSAMRGHMRMSATNTALDTVITDAINDAAAKLHGDVGELNRTLFPTRWKRYMSRFPDLRNDDGTVNALLAGPILLPYGPLLDDGDVVVTIEDGESPTSLVDPATYVVKTGMLVPEVWPARGLTWPDVDPGPQAVSMTYTAGYSAFPRPLQRMVKILAAHYVENPEATINEQRQMMINRRVDFGMDDLREALKIANSLIGWDDD